MGNTGREAIDKARKTVAIYLPYLQTILRNHQIDPDSAIIKRIAQLSKEGKIEEASRLVPNEIVKALSLAGTPDQLAERIQKLRMKIPFNGILFSPPYGSKDAIEENIRYLKKELVDRLQ